MGIYIYIYGYGSKVTIKNNNLIEYIAFSMGYGLKIQCWKYSKKNLV